MRDYYRRAFAFARDTMRQPVKAGRDLHFSDLAFFLRFARPIWRVGVLALIATALVSAAKTVLPLSIKFFIDNVLLGETPDPGSLLAGASGLLSSLNALIVALLVLGFFTGGMDLIRNYWTARFREDYAFNLQTALFEHVLSFPLSYFKSQQTGYILSRLSDDVQILQYTISQYLPQIVANALYVVFAFAILCTLNLRLTFVVVAFIPLYLLVNAVFIRRIRAATYRERERQAYVSRDLAEVITGIETVKSHAAEDREVHKVSRTLREMVDARIRNTMLSAASEYFRIGTMSLMLIAVFWFGGNEVLAGVMTVGDFVAFAVYIVTFAPTVNTFFAFPVVMQPALTSAPRLRDLFAMHGEPGAAHGTGGIVPGAASRAPPTAPAGLCPALCRDDSSSPGSGSATRGRIRSCGTQTSLSTPARWSPSSGGPAPGRRRWSTLSSGRLCRRKARSPSTGATLRRSTPGGCGGRYRSSPRTSSSSTPPLRITSVTAGLTPPSRRSWRPHGRRRSTTISCGSRRDTGQSSASAEPSSLSASGNGSPSPGRS
ncbi:putative Xenobiotic-transporting ATPase [Methanoculleus bourgensis]|uniref:Putative Xenobiotic-transporting ATPase n=1 Tax=Methanoculleus bourgensis TaxID=83986 RepID=A0A0X3BRS8_9EURY|nr:putative Xenobiotic-transporting ATPase [Methanoculleus bourgensis]